MSQYVVSVESSSHDPSLVFVSYDDSKGENIRHDHRFQKKIISDQVIK